VKSCLRINLMCSQRLYIPTNSLRTHSSYGDPVARERGPRKSTIQILQGEQLKYNGGSDIFRPLRRPPPTSQFNMVA